MWLLRLGAPISCHSQLQQCSWLTGSAVLWRLGAPVSYWALDCCTQELGAATDCNSQAPGFSWNQRLLPGGWKRTLLCPSKPYETAEHNRICHLWQVGRLPVATLVPALPLSSPLCPQPLLLTLGGCLQTTKMVILGFLPCTIIWVLTGWSWFTGPLASYQFSDKPRGAFRLQGMGVTKGEEKRQNSIKHSWGAFL